ncbi:MAG: hypothetical protein V4646_04440 [Pseudomonadota bacterium]
MNKIIVLLLWAAWGFAVQAQTAATVTPSATPAQATPDAERARISAERARLESKFAAENAACYKKFLVNNCLDKIKIGHNEALADLRRQEISLDAEDRKARGAEQMRKTEEKMSPEKQQEAADRRASSLKDYESRLERERQKNADRATTQSNEKSSIEAAANRVKSNQEKAGERSTKQAAAAEETRKFNEKQEKAKERQAQHERDKLNQTKPPAKSLPTPD